jgi:hypothetical protein
VLSETSRRLEMEDSMILLACHSVQDSGVIIMHH